MKEIFKTIKVIILAIGFLLLVPIKWLMSPIIKLCSSIEIKIADYTIYFLNQL